MKASNPEKSRLKESSKNLKAWKKWGPYLSERQWGTVREDYSPDGEAWDYFPHEHARSRAYRWGEDGIAGISDDWQYLCLSLAVWNSKDPFLKERLFGLSNGEGNHGEDVKEYYYYLDATPTHSYLKMLYKYPQGTFPYDKLVQQNRKRGFEEKEYELIDTGVLKENRYFDIEVEYAKADAEDILMRVTAINRGPEAAEIYLIPQLWFRNIWSWNDKFKKPSMRKISGHHAEVEHSELGIYYFYAPDDLAFIFTENETNSSKLFDQNTEGPFKDAFHEYLANRNHQAISPEKKGTKLAAFKQILVEAGKKAITCVRLSKKNLASPFQDFEHIFLTRINESNQFYQELQNGITDQDARHVQRQAYAGMIWTKQFYHYDIREWLKGDTNFPPPPEQRKDSRNNEWFHLNNADIISMPDKWEYPWYAAWDLAFHCLPLAYLDADFAKQQLVLMTREWYMHPNGQLPAYEWNFSDVNPPVHAWATWRVYQIDRKLNGKADHAFLESVFHKLMLNFTWWVNRKDAEGRNVFQGGFLGLDNIGVFDRSKALPTGGYLDQADGTSWMAMFSLNMMKIALELARTNEVYEDIATKFFEHYLYIAEAMTKIGEEGVGLWDEEDSFYYDVLNLPGGQPVPLKVRSMVGLIPLFAVETLEPELLKETPHFAKRMEWFLNYRKDLAQLVSHWEVEGAGQRRLLSLLRGHRMKCLLRRMLDESEFLSPYGIRGLSRYYKNNPYCFSLHGNCLDVTYSPAESTNGMFGGNSNWRGPVWFPVNYLIIESLQKFHHYYGNDFKIEYPTGSGNFVTILQVANELSSRLINLFLKDERGNRPIYGHHKGIQSDPHFKDHILFYEYFHGDNGRGIGASHQTGWTGLVAKLIQQMENN
ncbi:MAG: glucosidase [Verrucomicrobiota bacterium]